MKSNLTLQTELARGEDLDIETRKTAKKILTFLYNVKSSFLSEIAWECGITEYETKIVLNHLKSFNAVEQINVDIVNPDKRLLSRVFEMSSKGQAGYNNFIKRRWFGRTDMKVSYD